MRFRASLEGGDDTGNIVGAPHNLDWQKSLSPASDWARLTACDGLKPAEEVVALFDGAAELILNIRSAPRIARPPGVSR